MRLQKSSSGASITQLWKLEASSGGVYCGRNKTCHLSCKQFSFHAVLQASRSEENNALYVINIEPVKAYGATLSITRSGKLKSEAARTL